MTPQFSFMVVAAVASDQVSALRTLLLSMNAAGRDADPENAVFPFAKFPRLHFARFVILDDRTSGDIAAYDLPAESYPPCLAFLGDFDGPSSTILPEFVAQASAGLTRIFLHCDASLTQTGLLPWLESHSLKPSALYVNQVGRTMQSVREEAALHTLLQNLVRALPEQRDRPATKAAAALKQAVRGEIHAGRLTLTPEPSTPVGWELANLLHLLAGPLALLVLSPILLLGAPFFLLQLRRLEQTDPEIAPRIDLDHANALAAIEDRDVTNQFSAFGSIKPGSFRRWSLGLILRVVDYTARHIYNRGRLARVSTIHFARWVFLDGGKRLFFASNYDGSLEAYMDDFINKVGFGLNAVFSHGIGYPATNWLILQGARDEQKFKYYLRRHQVPTEVWYNAHAGLTAFALERNARIRRGLEADWGTESEAAAWLRLL